MHKAETNQHKSNIDYALKISEFQNIKVLIIKL